MNRSEETAPESTPHFYRNLTGFNDFSEIDNDNYYKKLPNDWFVVISDIEGSTVAIESGRYKDVNTLGAASISVLQKSLGTFHFPFVFGGDGATALVHQSDLESAKSALLNLKALSKSQFNMKLRVGTISVQEVYAAGHAIEVGKFFMNPQKSIAMIRGGGLSWADNKIKTETEKYCLQDSNLSGEDLDGLSCRWQPLKSNRGKVVTILALPSGNNPRKVLRDVVAGMKAIFKGDLNRACPVQKNNMQYKSLFRCLMDEWKYNRSHLSEGFFRRALSIVISVWAFKLKLPIFFDSQNYVQSIFAHSDYRKFDDLLRMVADCTHEEATELEKMLQEFYVKGELFFGFHYSDYSLMTCLVENLQQGGHIHFIDGGDGGYAMAAKSLKQQMKQSQTSPFQQTP